MVGGAAEALLLQLRDVVVAHMGERGQSPPKDLLDERVKKIIIGVQKAMEMRQADMPRALWEEFEAYWPAFTQQIRAARNDAGHPADLDAVTPERVYAALMLFPDLAALSTRLVNWVQGANTF
jgi:hypothetical protein